MKSTFMRILNPDSDNFLEACVRKQHILVSGGTGFVGQALLRKLVADGHQVTALFRKSHPVHPEEVHWYMAGDLAAAPLIEIHDQKFDVCINLAAPTRPSSDDPEGSHSDGAKIARNISKYVVASNIPRIIVLSSVAAQQASLDPGSARRYGIEKLAADKIFTDMLRERELVILRPPAIYGEGMRNSLSTLISLVKKGLPIPLGKAVASRHYISVANVCDLITTILSCPSSTWPQGTSVLLPSDGVPVSTRDLIGMIGRKLGKSSRLVPVPLSVLRLAGKLSGRSEMISGAIDGLDMPTNAPITKLFGWQPAVTMPDSLGFIGR
jgi:nucleoside-diphosphate-sugar epimerase